MYPSCLILRDTFSLCLFLSHHSYACTWQLKGACAYWFLIGTYTLLFNSLLFFRTRSHWIHGSYAISGPQFERGQSRWASHVRIIEKRKGRGERCSNNFSQLQLINALFPLLRCIQSGKWGSFIRPLPTILEPDYCRNIFPSVVVVFFFFRIIKLFMDKNV